MNTLVRTLLAAAILSPVILHGQAPITPNLANPPFSPFMIDGDTVYVSGSVGKTAATPTTQTTTDEARAVLDSIQKGLSDRGLTMDDLLYVQVFCTDLKEYEAFNTVYRTFFHRILPARAFIGVNQLVLGAHFEVMGVARKGAATTKHAL